MPLDASAANECTLVKIPDLTKMFKTLNEKHRIDKKTITFKLTPLTIIRE